MRLTIRAPRGLAILLLTLGMLVAIVGLLARSAQAVPAPNEYPSTDVPVEIVDADTVTSTLTVPPGEPFIDDLDVTMTLSHESADDLDVSLEAPSGTTVELFTDVCSSGGDETKWGDVVVYLDDEASAAIGDDCPPLGDGQYQPEDLLSDFDGQNPSGEWNLTITDDDADGSSGQLISWNIIVTPPEPIVVTSALDPGNGVCDATCTLREAITLANADTAGDMISFNIPTLNPNDVVTITPASQLPTITSPVIIDGYTQPNASKNTLAVGNNAQLLIELSGASDPGFLPGPLWITAGDSTVRGLVIHSWHSSLAFGILLETNGGNLVEGNFIGTSPSGETALGGQINGGVRITSADNIVGGTDPEARNVISGNTGTGVNIGGTGATGNVVQGNYIGTDADGTDDPGSFTAGVSIGGGATANTIGGTAAGARNVISGNSLGVGILGSGTSGNTVQGNYIGTDAAGTSDPGTSGVGVRIQGAPSNIVGGTATAARNVISGNDSSGIELTSSSTGNSVLGNYIGTDAAGETELGNGNNGVAIVAAPANDIGGTAPGAGNVISGNGSHGVHIVFGGATSNTIQGNYIGTDADGDEALGNLGDGVNINEAFNNDIGGTAAGAGNVISGNSGSGVEMLDFADGNVVQGNYIGTDATGSVDLGNSSDGVFLFEADNNAIGGTGPGAGNTIAFNGGTGVAVAGSLVSTEDDVRGNSIHSNDELGIDLGNDGVTANDSNDVDGGQNEQQNFPEITGASTEGGATIVEGALNSTPNTTFDLDFFTNDACDPSGHGEGQTYLGSASVTTDGSGNATFSEAVSGSVGAGDVVTATTTDPDGNTSEFSACNPPLPIVVNTTSFGDCDGAACSLPEAINRANATTATDVITFDIGTGPVTINLFLALPTITEPVVIDGTTQPGFSGTPIVELNGTSAFTASGGPADGLRITAGDTTIRGLVINRFGRDGIELSGAGGNVIRGNYIGTDSSGTGGFGNGGEGIRVDDSSDNFIGGAATGAGNLISGNGVRGVAILGPASTGNVVRGNLIGTDAAGTANLGNGIHGIFVSQDASDNTIGGVGPNTIAFNAGDGVRVFSGTGNAVQENSIHSNGELGIDLGTNGVTPNDPGDEDGSPNMLQNFPVLDAAVAGGGTTVFGSLESEADTDYLIHFWHNASCDPSGNGEGETYLGNELVSTDPDGLASFREAFAPTLALGRQVTALAVDPAGNTSEFSACEAVTAKPILSIGDIAVTEGNSDLTPATFTVTRTGNTGGTARVAYRTSDGTALAPGDYASDTGTVFFEAGETTATLTVDLVGDTLDEANETFTVRLSSPVDATISDGLATGTITDDDPSPQLSINDITVDETDSPIKVTFTVTLTGQTAQTVTVNFATQNGTAVAPSDYGSRLGTLTFNPGVTTRDIVVTIKGGNVVEPTEHFFMNLSGAVNATISDSQGQATIQDDD